jgi:hypothetical protein
MFPTHPNEKELVSTDEFLALSAEIAYQLSGAHFHPEPLLALLLDENPPPAPPEVFLDAIEILKIGYGGRRRRLGPAAVLHPLRATALMARSMRHPTQLDLLGVMFHDKEEDLTHEELGPAAWQHFDASWRTLLERLDPEHRWFLGERITLLAIQPGDSYNAYLARLLDHAAAMPDLLHIKMVDRLDNTLDVSVTRPGIARYNFFRTVFDILFVPTWHGVRTRSYHQLPDMDEGLQMLSNLFKNAIFLSLLRSEGRAALDEASVRLTDAIAVASMRIAQFVALNVFAQHLSLEAQRRVIHEVMDYCAGGGLVVVRKGGGHLLDGLFLDCYNLGDPKGRRARLSRLWQDHEMLARLSVLFIAVFACFLNDPEFHLNGIDRHGIWAAE